MTERAALVAPPAPLTNPVRLLLPYQQRWNADKSGVKVCEKSRRIGITWATACDAVFDATTANGSDWWFIGYNQDAALEFVRDCAWWVKVFTTYIQEMSGDDHALTEGAPEEVYVDTEGEETNRKVVGAPNSEAVVEDEKESILAYQVRFLSGHRITVLTSKPRNLRGKKGNIIIDEAAFHDDLPGLRKSAMATRMWGFRVFIISTHFGVTNDFNTLCEDIRAGKFDYSLHKITFDDAIADGLYRRRCFVTGEKWTQAGEDAFRDMMFATYGDDALEELLCIPSKSGGPYLSTALIESRMFDAPVVRLSLPDNFLILDNGQARPEGQRTAEFAQWLEAEVKPLLRLLRKDRPHFFGWDFGRVSDLSVFAPVELTVNLRRTVPFLIELRNVPHDQQREFLIWIVPRLPMFGGGILDAGGNGESLGEMAATKFGPEICQALKLTNEWYATNLPPAKAAIEDGMLTFPRDQHVRDDLCAFQIIDGVPKLPKAKTSSKRVQGKTVTRHGDAAIAIVLGYTSSRGGGTSGDYYAVKRTGRTLELGRGDDDDPGLGMPRNGRGIF